MEVKKKNDWSDPEFMREYRRKYYLEKKKKEAPEEPKPVWNAEHFKEYHKAYYQANKEKINDKRRQTRQTCELCFGHFTKDSQHKHEESQRHKIALSIKHNVK
jgi:hypothetical protein